MAGNTVTRTTLTVDVGFNDDVTGELGFKTGQILAQAKTDIEKLNENITTSIERKPYRERDESAPRKPRAAKAIAPDTADASAQKAAEVLAAEHQMELAADAAVLKPVKDINKHRAA